MQEYAEERMKNAERNFQICRECRGETRYTCHVLIHSLSTPALLLFCIYARNIYICMYISHSRIALTEHVSVQRLFFLSKNFQNKSKFCFHSIPSCINKIRNKIR